MDSNAVALLAAPRMRAFSAAKIVRLIAMTFALGGALLLSGCGPERTGATLSELNKKIGGPGAKSRIVIVRGKDITLIDSGWKVYLDGGVMGDLKTGTFVYRDSAPGTHRLMFSRPGDFARASTREFVAAPGRTYVYRLDMNTKGQIVLQSAVAAGLVGMLVSSAIAHSADERGYFDFTLLEGSDAERALADIRLSN